MSNEETDKTPDKILQELLGEIVEQEDSPFAVITHEKSVTLRATEGHFILAYHFGDAVIAPLFDTHGLADFMYTACSTVLDTYLRETTGQKDGNKVTLSELFPDEENRRYTLQGLVEFALRTYLCELPSHLAQALTRLDESMHLFIRGIIANMFDAAFRASGVSLITATDLRIEAERMVKEFRSEERSYLLGSLNRIEGKPDFSRLAEHYQFLLPKWQDAKRVFKQNGHRTKWKAIIESAVEGVQLPDDLLSRLAGPQAALSNEVQAGVLRTGADSSPSNLAIEHAARLCNCKPYENHVRTLFDRMRRQSEAGDPAEIASTH